MNIKKVWLSLSGYGALWLTAATLLTKLIGVMQKIPLQNLAGDSVFGIYNVVYPIYQMMMALGIAGIPTALASYIATQHQLERERTLSVALVMSSCAALLTALIGLASASWIGIVIGHAEVVSSLRVLALALLVTPIIAVYRGYYQGVDAARVSSMSQLLEQLVRVVCMVLLLWIGLTLNWSDSVMSAAVMWGSVIGAIITLLWFIRRHTNLSKLTIFSNKWSEWKREAVKLLKLALPTALAAIVVPMVAVVDALSIPRLLAGSGGNSAEVMAQFGQYSRIQPLIQLVAMLLAAFAAGFLPSWVKQARDLSNRQLPLLANRLLIMHRLALLVGCGAAAGLYILAEPINMMLYKDAVGLTTFRILAITTAASSLLAIQAPLLQGAGITRLSIWLVMLAAGSKALLNIWLVPQHGIEGAALAANLSLFFPACVGFLALYRAARQMNGVSWQAAAYRELLAPLLAISGGTLAMLIVLQLLRHLWWAELTTRLHMTGYAVIAVCVGAAVYGLIIWVSGALKKDEWKQLT